MTETSFQSTSDSSTCSFGQLRILTRSWEPSPKGEGRTRHEDAETSCVFRPKRKWRLESQRDPTNRQQEEEKQLEHMETKLCIVGRFRRHS